jgi:predicted NAD-dependent protein-ADP-ribosyltransferase YbiA (DUF1768 family)
MMQWQEMAARSREETVLDGEIRIIRKPDGTVVTVRPNGEVLVERPGGLRVTHYPDGRSLIETADGQCIERAPKLPRSRRPLNVASTSGEEIGRLMSNFAPTPFVLDGVRYACIEAFYVCLKFSGDPGKQRDVRRMDGRSARRAGRESAATTAVYGGHEVALGSGEHHALIKRAIRAKLDQNPEVARAFVATHPRPIVHNTGHAERKTTALPAEAFARMLTELREEALVALGPGKAART